MPNQNPSNPGQSALIGDKEKQPSNNGTGFVNLQKYLDANQGNQLGGAVAGNINQATQATKQDLSGQQQAFNQGLQNARSGIAQGQQNVSGIFNQLDKPDFNGLSNQQVQGYQNLVASPYSGPTGYQNAQQLQQQAANASGLGQLAGSRPGRQELLRETVNAPNYTGSQQKMDELFMSLGGGQNAVRQAGQGTRQLASQVAGGVDAAKQQGQQAQTAYNQLQQQANSGVQGRQTSINQAVNQQVNAAQQQQQKRQSDFSTYQQMLASGNPGAAGFAASNGLFDSGTANALSQISAQLPSAQNITQDLYGNINQGSLPTTPGAISTAQQKAQLKALGQLSGQQAPSWINDPSQQAVAPSFNLNAAQKQQILNDVMNKYYTPDQQTALSQLSGGVGNANLPSYGSTSSQQFLTMSPQQQNDFLGYLQQQAQSGFIPEAANQALGIYQGIQQGQQQQQALTPLLNQYTK